MHALLIYIEYWRNNLFINSVKIIYYARSTKGFNLY